MKDNNPKKIKIGSIKETAIEIAALVLPDILDPMVASDPTTLTIKTIQKISSHYLNKFHLEYKQRFSNGEIKKVGFKTEKPVLSFNEAIRIISSGEIDDDKFIALKSIFFSGITKDSSKQDEFWSYEFLKTLADLSGTEILILKANFDICKGNISKELENIIKQNSNKFNRKAWMGIIAQQMNLKGHFALVSKYESNLVKLGLIYGPNSDNRFSNDFEAGNLYRLTDTGYKFCEFVTKYDN